MEDESPSCRSWADECNDKLQSPRALGYGSPGSMLVVLLAYGPEGSITLIDSEDYFDSDFESTLPPLSPGKGKEVAGPSQKHW
jgi:hypothetical protein